MQLEQKWLTGIQIITQPSRDRKNSKIVNIAPGVYLLLTFCENNKDPIYEIEFMGKPIGEWIQIKGSENIQSIIGTSLCYKTQPSEHSGPICDVQLIAFERKNRFGENKDVINVPHGYKIASNQLPLGYLIFRKVKGIIEQTFKPILAEKYCPFQNSKVNLSQLPLFCFPDGIKLVKQIRGFATFNFIFTTQNAQRVYVTCLIFKENLDNVKRQKLGLYTQQNVFYEKALCLTSKFCYTDQFAECLQHLYRLSLSKSQIPFYKLIQTFAHQLTFPRQAEIGKIGIQYSYSGNSINFTTNDRYPIISERALYSVFKFLTVDNIINVFEALLLQKKVFFVSQSKTILGFAIQAFTSFLFPFKWEQVVIPILPYCLKQYLTAPVPLVAGISPMLVDSSIQDDSVIVFLDKNEVLNDEDLPPLPEKLLKQLKKRLQKMQVYDSEEVSEFLENPESTYLFKMQEVQDPHFQGYLVRDIFFQFTLTLMRNYKKFVTKKSFSADSSTFELEGVHLFTDFFKVQNFLSDMGSTKVGSFGYKFTEGSIFTSFIERICKNSNDPEIIFFDYCIERKKAKKQTIFIEMIKNEEYRTIKNPEVDPEQKGPFFYEKFPSLLQEHIQQEEIQINIAEQDPSQIQSSLKTFIQEQFYQNSAFFEKSQLESNPTQMQVMINKMFCLLLNSNKKKLDQFISEFKDPDKEKREIYEFFIGLYTQQCSKIETILEEWPKLVSEVKSQTLSKFQYFKRHKQFQASVLQNEDSRKIYLICQSTDCQILIRGCTKIILLSEGEILKSLKPVQSIAVQIKSYKLKNFMNSILPKQSNFFIDYIQKQNLIDLRKSAFKKIAYRTWNIESLLSFRDWIHYQKQFGTGLTSC